MEAKMMKGRIVLATLLALASVQACDSSTGSPPDYATACSKLVQYCPSGYSWSSYVTGEQQCREAFDCTYNFYSGNCRARLSEGVDCLAGVTDASGCQACDDIIAGLSSDCAQPVDCF
jgi:hypothetical protein